MIGRNDRWGWYGVSNGMKGEEFFLGLWLLTPAQHECEPPGLSGPLFGSPLPKKEGGTQSLTGGSSLGMRGKVAVHLVGDFFVRG